MASVTSAPPISLLVSSYVGGLVGVSGSTIEKCYSTGVVLAASGTYIYKGGLLGYKGENGGVITACFWDTKTSGITNGVGGGTAVTTGKTTAEMQTLSTFTLAGWDFTNETANGTDDYWQMRCEGMNYPKLSWQVLAEGDFVCPDGVAMEDFSYLAQRWQRADCAATDDCEGADLNNDGTMDLDDLAAFAESWLEGV
jgi:hypothetical protein